MPYYSVRVHETDRPWMNSQLKALIARRQKALATNNVPLFKIYYEIRSIANGSVAARFTTRIKLKACVTPNHVIGGEK